LAISLVAAPVANADEAWVVTATVFASSLLTEDLSYTDAAWIAEGSLTTPTLSSFSHSAEQLSRFPKHAATLSQWAQVEAREAAEFCATASTRREVYRQGHPGRVTIREKDDPVPNWYKGWVEIIERW
jgi:hypothetical protein